MISDIMPVPKTDDRAAAALSIDIEDVGIQLRHNAWCSLT